MSNTTNNLKPGFVVSEIILEQDGRFTIKDIIDKVRDKIESLFSSIDKLKDYVLNKLNSMCEYGLIGKTDAYYFSI